MLGGAGGDQRASGSAGTTGCAPAHTRDAARDAACPISAGGGTRRVRLVRGWDAACPISTGGRGGGGGGGARAAARCPAARVAGPSQRADALGGGQGGVAWALTARATPQLERADRPVQRRGEQGVQHPPPPYFCPYPCPYCTLPLLTTRRGNKVCNTNVPPPPSYSSPYHSPYCTPPLLLKVCNKWKHLADGSEARLLPARARARAAPACVAVRGPRASQRPAGVRELTACCCGGSGGVPPPPLPLSYFTSPSVPSRAFPARALLPARALSG